VLDKVKTILVTGGGGFLGSHLCERLLKAGHIVYCLDNFATGAHANINHLDDHASFFVLEHDVTEPLTIGTEFDEIYNLACPASPVVYQSDPVKTVKTNVQGAINVLELARKSGATVLQASTSEIYGDPDQHPQQESYWGNVNPIGPRACYDEGKRCAETLFFDYHRQHGLNIKVARIFNTYGPRMGLSDGRVVSNFIVQALQCNPITIFGDGNQTRSFCYVDDLVDGLIKLIGSPASFKGPVNLGNPVEIDMLKLAEIVLTLTQSSSKVTYSTLPEDDPRQRRPDISRAKEHLGWQPTVSINDGMERTVEYFSTLLR